MTAPPNSAASSATKIFLCFSVLLWLPYGLYCALVPTYLAEVAGVVATNSTGLTEIRAMYGGLQAGIGAMCALALGRPKFAASALFALSFLTGGLALVRILGFLLDDSGSGYTYGATLFELANTACAVSLARRSL